MLGISGCALFQEKGPEVYSFKPQVRVYKGSFEEVWRAVQKSTQGYPLAMNDIEKGIIKTEVVKGESAWVPVHSKTAFSDGYGYFFLIRAIKGKSQGQDVVKVSIKKDISKSSDFFAKPKSLPSDGLEEQRLHYRIKRELQIERALDRAYKRSQES